MKVKVNELKTHLSRYLRELDQTGAPVEICVREKTVAYLTRAEGGPVTGRNGVDAVALRTRLLATGLRWNPASHDPETFSPAPEPAADGRVDHDSVQAMRSERNW
jgi:antitoxin (DNA-binding transcriptional repressor) of toxin-antitoxin stability system